MTSELRILVLGKPGSGKSATGNTILGRKVFREEQSDQSVTRESKRVSRQHRGRNISVIDTPAISNTESNKIERFMELSSPGPHAFLLVLRLGHRITQEENNAVQWIKDNFGEKALKHTIIVFTCADHLDKPAEEYLLDSPELKRIVDMCMGRYVFFNNRTDDVTQVDILIEKIDGMVRWNGSHYRKEQFDAHRRQILEEIIATGALLATLAVGLGVAFALKHS